MLDTAPPPISNISSRDADWARLQYERQATMLGQMAEAGLELALTIKDEVKAQALEISAGRADAAVLAFARVARAVRMTLLLQTRAIEAVQRLDHAVTADARSEARDRKARVERIVERVAYEARDDAGEAEGLVREAEERLDHDDIYGDVLTRPVSELVAMICKDLGLDPDWPRLAQEAWAKDEVRSGAVGWPLSIEQAPAPQLTNNDRHRRTCSKPDPGDP